MHGHGVRHLESAMLLHRSVHSSLFLRSRSYTNILEGVDICKFGQARAGSELTTMILYELAQCCLERKSPLAFLVMQGCCGAPQTPRTEPEVGHARGGAF